MRSAQADQGLVEHLEGRARNIGRVLAISSCPNPKEGIKEVAFRAASTNGFQSTGLVVELARSRSFRSLQGVHEGFAEDLDRLVDVLGIRKDTEHVKQLLAQKGMAGKDWVQLLGIDIRRGHLAKERRVAPRTLRLNDCQNSLWALRPFSFDLSTKEALLDHCPVCTRKLGWLRTFGPSFCDKCPNNANPSKGGVDLRDFPQPDVDIEDEEAIQFVAELLDLSIGQRGCLHPDLSNSRPGAIFQLIAGRLEERPSGWGRALRPRSIEQGARALLNWPEGYHALKNDVAAAWTGRKSALDGLHLVTRLPAEIRGVIKSQDEEFKRRRAARRVRLAQPCAPDEPVRLRWSIRHSGRAFERLINSVDAVSQIEAIVTLLRHDRQARLIAADLGLPLPNLIDLYGAGMLPEMDALMKGAWAPPCRAFDVSLFAVARRAAADTLDHGRQLDLFSAASAFGHLNGSGWVAVLNAIFDCDLEVTLGPSRVPLVRRMRTNDFEGLRKIMSSFSDRSPSDLIPMTRQEMSVAIGKSMATTNSLVHAGMLARNASGADVAEFKKRWMLPSDAEVFLSLSICSERRNVRALLADEGVPSLLAGNLKLWSRPAVIALFPNPFIK